MVATTPKPTSHARRAGRRHSDTHRGPPERAQGSEASRRRGRPQKKFRCPGGTAPGGTGSATAKHAGEDDAALARETVGKDRGRV